MNWLRVSQNSAPLYRDSGVGPDDFVVQPQSTGCGRDESFFNAVDDVFHTNLLRFCLPHQVRSQIDVDSRPVHTECGAVRTRGDTRESAKLKDRSHRNYTELN